MMAPRRLVEMGFQDEEASELERLAQSWTEPTSWVARARRLLAYRETPVLLCGWTRHRGDASDARALSAASRAARRHGGAREQPAAGTRTAQSPTRHR
jgi:hypothetical protein